MIGERYVGFIEATVFDTGYRRACSDLLGILERAVGQTVSVGNARVAIDGNPRRQVIWK